MTAACGPRDSAAPPPPSPPDTAAPVAAAPADTQWIARRDGVGPIRIGMTVAELEGVLGGKGTISRIEPDAACGYLRMTGVPSGVSFMVSHDTIVRIEFDSAGIATPEGAQVGSAEADVVRAFGAAMRVEPHKYTGPTGHYLVAPASGDTTYRVVFETDGQHVTQYRVGVAEYVALVEGCA